MGFTDAFRAPTKVLSEARARRVSRAALREERRVAAWMDAVRRAGLPVILGAILSVAALDTARADFEGGMAAYKAGEFDEAYAAFIPLAEAEDCRAQYAVALLHMKGRGTEKNEAAAHDWFQRAAINGHLGAHLRLGDLYAEGAGVAASQVEAYKWYTIAAAQGHPTAATKRDSLAASMTAAELQSAQASAATWMTAHADAIDDDKRAGFASELKRLREMMAKKNS